MSGLVLADTDAARAREIADALGGEAVERTDALFSARIDGLVVATATDAHARLVLRAVDAGIPVFCEKPVAPDIEGTVEILRRVEALRVPVQVGFQRRFDAGYEAARDAVRSGSLGWVHTLRACTFDPAPPPAAYVAISGGLFRDCSVHDFDIVRWVTGREVVEVYAVGENRGAHFFREAGDVDTAAAVLRLDDASIGLVSASRYNAAGYDVRLEVLGSKRGVCVGLDDDMAVGSAEPGATFPRGTPHVGFLERFAAAYQRELAAFVDVVARRAESACTVTDALEALYVAEACDRSRRERRAVRVAEVRR